MSGTRRALARYGRQHSHGRVVTGRGIPKAAPKPKRSAHNVCDTHEGGCGHFRSDHLSSHACRIDGCDCQEMVW